MKKNLVHNFAIKLAAPVKVIKASNKSKRVSRKCYAVVVDTNGTLQARITSSPVEKDIADEYLLLPFTNESLELKGKRYVFLKQKDEYGHYICIIRDTFKALFGYGHPSYMSALRPGLLISGHIVRNNGKMNFDYEQLIAFHENGVHINEVKINEDKPLFD